MKVSASNIAWSFEQDDEILALLRSLGYDGLEVAPTRLYPERPYTQPDGAKLYAAALLEQYGLRVASMQSVLFGITQNLFGPEEERAFLRDYLRAGVVFAKALGCGNINFGCPKNRLIGEASQYGIAVDFFRRLSAYAAENGAVVAIEPVPAHYGGNFLHTTQQACAFARDVDHPACMVNADTGAMVSNGEPFSVLEENIGLVHHIHLSEPNLAPVRRRAWHSRLRELPFEGYLSLEMKKTEDPEDLRRALYYLREVAG